MPVIAAREELDSSWSTHAPAPTGALPTAVFFDSISFAFTASCAASAHSLQNGMTRLRVGRSPRRATMREAGRPR
ncbi:MAG: hypothetical protein U1F36_13045 [Planctomycetota bacterium]